VPPYQRSEKEALLKQHGFDASMNDSTLVFRDPLLEAKYIQSETRDHYVRYAVIGGLVALVLLTAIVMRDAAFYISVWKDAESCEGLFSPRCRSLGLRIVVALFAFPAILFALCLHHAYATRVRVVPLVTPQAAVLPAPSQPRRSESSQPSRQFTTPNSTIAPTATVSSAGATAIEMSDFAKSQSRGHDDGVLGKRPTDPQAVQQLEQFQQEQQRNQETQDAASHLENSTGTSVRQSTTAQARHSLASSAATTAGTQRAVERRGTCMCRGVPIDVALAVLLAGGCFVYSRTVNDENSALPVDLTAVTVFFVYIHTLASFLSCSYAMAVLSWIGYFGYAACTIGFAFTSERLLYSSDYAAASAAAQVMEATMTATQFAPFSLTKRRFELVWALFWPLAANAIAACAARQIELKRRQNFAMFERFALMNKQNMELKKQVQDLWHELFRTTPDTLLVEPEGGEGDFDLISPAERAVAILREVQRDADMTNDSFMKIRRVIMLLTSAHDYFKPPVSNRLASSANNGDDEVLRWVFSLMDPYSVASVIEKRKAKSGQVLVKPQSQPTNIEPLYIPPPLADADEEVIQGIIANVDDWSYDVFELDTLTNGHPLVYMGIALFRKYRLQEKFCITNEILSNFLRVIEEAYLDKPYHNRTHAADVMRTTSYFISRGGLGASMTDLEILAALIAAAVHDVGHPGINNQFHIASKHELALLYNDRSVLENYHAAYAFRLLMRPENNILAKLESSQYDECRRMIIDMVLSTDLQHHFEYMGQFKSMLSSSATAATDTKFRAFGMRMAVKCADVGHAAKPLHQHLQWCSRVCEEFYKQGDQERKRKLPISPFMDRNNPNVPKSQIGFFDFIVGPMYEAFMTFLEPPAEEDSEDGDPLNRELSESVDAGVAPGLTDSDEEGEFVEEKEHEPLPCLQQVAENRAYWVSQLDLQQQQQRQQQRLPSPQEPQNDEPQDDKSVHGNIPINIAPSDQP